MVLFKDDEERMKKKEREEKLRSRTKFGIWVRRIIKSVLVLGVLFIAGIWLLSGLSGSSDALKKGIEDYLMSASGMWVEIGTLNDMAFFPDLKLDAENITFSKEQDGPAAIRVGAAKFQAGFINMMLSRRKFRTLEIKDVHANAGIIDEHELVLSEIALKDEAVDGKPAVVVNGRYGTHDIKGHAIMEKEFDGKLSYKMPAESSFRLDYGVMALTGAMHKAPKGGLQLDIKSLGFPEKLFAGKLILNKRFSGLQIRAGLDFGESKVLTDLKFADGSMDGTVSFPVLKVADVEHLVKLYEHYYLLPGVRQKEEISFDGLDYQLEISVDKLLGPYNGLGGFTARADLEERVLNIHTKGKVSDGALDATLSLNVLSLPAKMNIHGSLKNWDYGLYQKSMRGRENVNGKADIKISLRSEAKNYDDLVNNLSGDATLIAGQAEMVSAALDIWGAGLINAMIPDLSPDSMTTLNCMIADFKIENGVARPDPLFMDTTRVTVVGDGEINLPENRINLKLEPKAKNPALLDVATAVNVSGPILRPQIGTDTFSLFEKLGGLALGFVNPAFLAFSLTDLGLVEGHPCHKFIGGAEQEKGDEERMKAPHDEEEDGATAEVELQKEEEKTQEESETSEPAEGKFNE